MLLCGFTLRKKGTKAVTVTVFFWKKVQLCTIIPPKKVHFSTLKVHQWYILVPFEKMLPRWQRLYLLVCECWSVWRRLTRAPVASLESSRWWVAGRKLGLSAVTVSFIHHVSFLYLSTSASAIPLSSELREELRFIFLSVVMES